MFCGKTFELFFSKHRISRLSLNVFYFLHPLFWCHFPTTDAKLCLLAFPFLFFFSLQFSAAFNFIQNFPFQLQKQREKKRKKFGSFLQFTRHSLHSSQYFCVWKMYTSDSIYYELNDMTVFLSFHSQAIDWGLETCKTIKVDILMPPQIRLEPPSVTLFKGESMRIRCMAAQSNDRNERLGYSWTKNNALFHSDPQFEMWEELYPEGSILTIQNLHKSATYACSISNSLAPVSASIHVNIVDFELVSICHENTSYGIKWPASSSGPPVLADCPFEYDGMALRYCEQQDYNISKWLMPDFSDCINQKLLRISTEVSLIPFVF